MAKMIAYKEEDIKTVLSALNSITIRGVDNAKFLQYAASVLQQDGHPAELEEKDEEEK